MRTVLLVLTAARLFGQQVLSPDAEFDLASQGKAHHASRVARCYFSARPNRLTFVRIDGGVASLSTADLNGRGLYAKSDFVSVHALITAARREFLAGFGRALSIRRRCRRQDSVQRVGPLQPGRRASGFVTSAEPGGRIGESDCG